MFFDILGFQPNEIEKKEIQNIENFLKVSFLEEDYFFGEPKKFNFSKKIFVTNTISIEKKFLVKLKEREKILCIPIWLVDIKEIKKLKKLITFIKKVSLRYCFISFPRKIEEIKSPKQLIAFSYLFGEEKNERLMLSLIGVKDEA
ncbi:MAG: hypothetical protein ACP5HJ_02340 [Candidatus Micrarchaeia archaeon]|jgi:hypothetical protein